MEYTDDRIKKILSNGKPAFKRLLPLNVDRFPTTGGNTPAMLPNQLGVIVTQDDYLRELNPSSHKIFDKRIYPDKFTVTSFDDNGEPAEWHIENIARVAFPFQVVIKTKQKNHLTGNPLKFTLTNNKPSDKVNDDFTLIRQTWIDKNMDIAFAEAVESQLTTGDTALYFFRDKGKLDWEVFSYAKGDVLIPIYNSVNRLQTLYRYFSTIDENGNDVEAMMIIDDTYVTEFRKVKDGRRKVWTETSRSAHGFSRIPAIYKRGKVAWDDVQNQIDEIEWDFSQFCESNAYFAFPILFIKGNVSALPMKGSQGKTLQGDEQTMANFLARNGGDIEAFKYQFETQMNMIFFGSFTVNITPDAIKSSGDMPGAAIRLIMHPEIDKAIELAKEWDEFVDGMKELFIEGIGLEMAKSTQIKELKFRIEIDIYTPENTQEIVNILNQSVTMGSLSKKTASEQNKYARSDEYDRIKSEEQERLDLEAKAKQANTVTSPDGTIMPVENAKQQIAAQ